MKNTLLLSSLFTGLILASFSKAADPIPTEDDYYKIVKFEIPKDVVLEAGSIELTADNKLYVSSRRGEIWSIDNPFAKDLAKVAKVGPAGSEIILSPSGG